MRLILLAASVAGLLLVPSVEAQVPQLISYQGRLTGTGTNFDGPGQFKFALVSAGTNVYWGNSGLTGSPLEPIAPVSIAVTQGLFNVLLGDSSLANMAIVPATVFTNPDVRLRVWFNDGLSGFQRLSPDQRLGAVGYALMAANVTDGAVTGAKLANNSITAPKIAAGAVGTAQLATGAVTSLRIATGAVGTAQLALNSVQASNIAPGAVGTTQLAKPPRSGSLSSSSLPISFDEAVFTVPFSPPFATAPGVTLTLQTTSESIANGSLLTSQSNSTGSFTGKWWMPKTAFTVVQGDVGQSCSMAALANGTPVIAYENSMQRPTFIRAQSLAGTTWFAPVPVDTSNGRQPSLALVNGNPAMSYNNVGLGDLKYARATDANGNAWATPVNVDTAGTVGSDDYLAVLANGFPAISYYADTPANDLKFARANDVNGATWAAPMNLDTLGDVGKHSCLAVVNGHPAISYFDVGNDRLKYIRATATNGSSWGASVVVDNSVWPAFTALTIVNGNPAICYASSSPFSLKYVRANDTNGFSWGTPVIVDLGAANISSISLKVISGLPTLSYNVASLSSTPLRYARATDANGTAWTRPASLESEGISVFQLSLGFFNNRPAVAYYSSTYDAIKFVTPRFSAVPPFNIVWMALEP